MSMSLPRWFAVVTISSVFWAAAALGQSDTAVATPVAESSSTTDAKGRLEAGPSNIRNFSPEESGVAIEPENLNLRGVFEDLGPDATLWFQHVQTLANAIFEGRAPGTRGGELAEEYLEFYMKLYELEPAFPGEVEILGGGAFKNFASYRQPFDFPAPTPKVKVLGANVAIDGRELVDGTDFTVLGNSANGSISAPITFVGYAIESEEEDYTSFDENTDLTGRIAFLFRYEPLDEAGKSKWSSTRFSRFSGMSLKIKSVIDRGAAGVILVNPPGAVDGKTGLEAVKDSVRFTRRQEVPMFQVTPEAADRLLAAVDPEKRDLLAWRKLADEGTVKAVNLDDDLKITLTADLEVDDRIHTDNVAGVLRGKGDLADQWIVIGAHYDHVGYGYTGAMPDNIGKLHPGADDNASGTAGLLLAAKRLVRGYGEAGDNANLRSVMFVGFSAEEAGLYGSKFLVENFPVKATDISLMINMDMIGRLRSNNLLAQGTGTAEGFEEMLKPHFESSGMKISMTPGGRGPSDHSSFYNAGVPVLFLFTGEHDEYHKPSDRAYTVNPRGAVQIVDLLESIVMDLSDNEQALKYVLTSAGGAGRNTGAKVRLGIQPAYNAEIETGVEVEAVTDGTSAADAGLKAGDVLLSWNGEELTGGQKLFELLGMHEPGDKVQLAVQRDGQTMSIDVTLKGREQN